MTGPPVGAQAAPTVPLLDVRGLSVRFGAVDAVHDVSLSVASGTIVGLIGPNGAGKTTAIDAITGFVPLAGGDVVFTGRRLEGLAPHARARLGMARTFQDLALFEDLTVGENLAVAREACRQGGGGLPERAGAGEGLDDVSDLLPARLPHSLRKQLALERALATAPRLMLLDEPFAGLDPADRAATAARLRQLADEGMGILVVDHDTAVVFDLCDEVVVLDAGRQIARGAPAAVRADPVVRDAYLGPSGPSERGSLGPGLLPSSPPLPAAELRPSPRPVSGPPVLEIEGLSAGYGDVPVLHDVSLNVAAGEVHVLLGANGAGKTTTLLAVSGILAPTAGRVSVLDRPVGGRADEIARRGVGHAPQDRGVMPGLTVAESLRLAGAGTGRAGMTSRRVRGVSGRRNAFDEALDWFPRLRPLLPRRCGHLSGGERQIVSLARAVAGRPRLLLVDEPSLGLGPALLAEVLASLRAMADEQGTAILLVEQHAFLALDVADRATVMARGRVVLEGPAAALAARPDRLEDAYLG